MSSVNARLQETAIRHALAVQRHGSQVAVDIVRLLNSADRDIVDILATRLVAIEERGFDLGPKTTKRLQAMLDEIRAINRAIYDRVHDQLIDQLSEFAEAEASFQGQALERAIPVDVAATIPSAQRLRALVETSPMEGRLLSSWAEGMEAGRATRIDQAIRLGILQGENTDKIVARIRGTKSARYSDGILDISRRSAQAIVRTSVNHVSNVTSQATWAANSGVVKGWQSLAVLDTRTTPLCASLDGKVFPIGEGPIPPRHINCRSISVAVTKSFRELDLAFQETTPAQRANMDGVVGGTTNYPTWLKGKSAEVQDDILGKARGRLFRSGMLSFQDLVRPDGQLMTLEQLKKSYPRILE